MNHLLPSHIENSFSSYPHINWTLLAKAQQYYANHNYHYCEVPYLIPESYGMLTKPHNDRSFILDSDLFASSPHELVGSAEQGFLYLMVNKQLKHDKLFSITPCFRTENYNGTTHFPWFMKCELFHKSSKLQDCQNMLQDAMHFFEQFTDKNNLNIIQTTNESWDIELNGIEIGSYGLRHFSFGSFIYGTGLALPRFDIAHNL